MSRAAASPRSKNSPTSAPDSRSPPSTWNCAARATCSAASRAATSKPSASRCTRPCWRRPSRKMKGEEKPSSATHAAQSRHQPAHRRELHTGRKPAPARLQEDRRRPRRSNAGRCARGARGSLRRPARERRAPPRRCDTPPRPANASASTDRPQARRAPHPLPEKAEVDPGRLMKLVARNAKKGAQFTPQGVLRFPIVRHREALLELRELCNTLAPSARQCEPKNCHPVLTQIAS